MCLPWWLRCTGPSPGSRAQPVAEEEPQLTPAEIRKSITPDALISFLDGKLYKTLKRHLGQHGLDPAGYWTKFGLPADYPLMAPNYSKRQSELAESLGSGTQARIRPAEK